jgi:hypothetical protein
MSKIQHFNDSILTTCSVVLDVLIAAGGNGVELPNAANIGA